MVRRKTVAAFACAVLVLGFGGCGSDSADSRPDASASKAADAPGSKTRVVVHDAGAEPRSRLRLAVAQGTNQHATMTMQMNMEMSVDGRQAPTNKVPPIQMGMAVSFPEVAKNGDVTATFKYDHLKVLGSGAMKKQMLIGLKPLEKVHGTVKTSATGALIDADFAIPGDMDPTMKTLLSSLKEQFANVMVPFPSEPVGVGATWTVHNEVAIDGIKAAADYNYQLLERQGDRVVLRTDYVQTYLEQDADIPTLPTGVTAHVHESKVNGAGRSEVDLTRLFPVNTEVEARGPIHMTMSQGTKSSEVVQNMHLLMKLSG